MHYTASRWQTCKVIIGANIYKLVPTMIDDRNLTIQFIICYKSVRQKIADLEISVGASMLAKFLGQKCIFFENFKNLLFEMLYEAFSPYSRNDKTRASIGESSRAELGFHQGGNNKYKLAFSKNDSRRRTLQARQRYGKKRLQPNIRAHMATEIPYIQKSSSRYKRSIFQQHCQRLTDACGKYAPSLWIRLNNLRLQILTFVKKNSNVAQYKNRTK